MSQAFFPIVTPQLAVERYGVHAMGRDAVDFITGDIITSGIELDGINNGFVVLQPEELFFNFDLPNAPSAADIIGITFIDQYNADDTLGYRAIAGETTWSPFIHDSVETRSSCTPITNSCFNNFGLNGQVPQLDLLVDNTQICGGASVNLDPNLNRVLGWVRLLIDGYEPLQNQLGVVAYTFFTGGSIRAGAEWMNVKGVSSTPPNECPLNPDGSPSDCSLAACKPLDGCENPNQTNGDGVNFCQDGVDNDGVNGTDCQDFGCDGFVAITSEEGEVTGPCESAGETSCADGFDNDLNGFIDCGLLGGDPDPTCVANGECGDDDDDNTGSGGCSVAASATAGTAAASFLLPLLPLAGAYALRSIRKRKK